MENLFAEIEEQTKFPLGWENSMAIRCKMGGQRDKFVPMYSWAIPSKDAINQIAEFWGQDLGIETGAGSGLWSHLLQLRGVNVKPTDTKSEYKKEYIEIEQLNAEEAIDKYSDANVLFLCWSRVNPTKKFKGNKIVYIGEDEYGCTDGIPSKDEWELTKTIKIPQWPYTHDFVYLYVRK
jgi:hypothetical protein